MDLSTTNAQDIEEMLLSRDNLLIMYTDTLEIIELQKAQTDSDDELLTITFDDGCTLSLFTADDNKSTQSPKRPAEEGDEPYKKSCEAIYQSLLVSSFGEKSFCINWFELIEKVTFS